MSTRIKHQTAESNTEVVEVKTAWSEAEANSLLGSKKWKLLHGGVAHADLLGYQVKPCWVMGRIE